MYITERNGKYRAWERFIVDGKVRKVSVTMDRNTAQSRRIAQDMLKERLPVPGDSVTFSELVSRYLADASTRYKPSTVAGHKTMLGVIEKQIGSMKLSKLNAGVLKSALLRIADKPMTLNGYLDHLKAVMRWAYQMDYIESASCVDKIKPWKVIREPKKKYLEKEELKKVVLASNAFYGPLIEFLALSGLRIGELQSLDDSDVTDVIRVTKTYDEKNEIGRAHV